MKPTPPPENPLLSLVVNILLPVIILNKASHVLGSQATLLVALCFPLVYGVHDYIRRGHKNYVSLLGIVNILSTAGLALMSVTGIWFAYKEASLPLLLGLLVFGSAWTANPAARIMFCNPHILNMSFIDERLSLLSNDDSFRALLRRTTLWLSLSFFMSSAANFVLAYDVFKEIDPTLAKEAQMAVLNEQISHMTWLGYAAIALPLMVFSALLIYVFLRQLSKLTEVPIDKLMKS